MVKELDLKNAISKEKFNTVYLLFGNDPYLIKRYADMISLKAVPQDRELNLVALNDNVKVQDIYDAVSQFSFTGGRICVCVANFNFEGCGLSEFKKLCEIIPEIPKNNILVLYYDILHIDPKKSNRFKNLTDVIEKNNGAVVELNHKTEQELIKMLCDGATRRGIKMDFQTAKYMIENCSDDLNILINELEKLAAYVGENGVVTSEIVDKVTSKTIEASIYDISKFILLKNVDKALQTLSDLLAGKVDPYLILSVINNTYIDIYRAKAAIAAGVKPEIIAADFDISPKLTFKLTNAAKAANTLSDWQLAQILKELLYADQKLKTGVASVVLEQLIIKIIKISTRS